MAALRFHVLSFTMVLSAAAVAEEYISVNPLLLRAIDAVDGKSRGIIVGPIADRFKRTTGSSASITGDVTTIKRFRQDGYKRLNARLTQSGVATSGGKFSDFGMDYGLNLCRDGSPPTEGMDLEQAGKGLER